MRGVFYYIKDMKKGYITNIKENTLVNNNFHNVLYAGNHLRLVLMSLRSYEDIHKEDH